MTTHAPLREESLARMRPLVPVWAWTVGVGVLAALIAALHGTGPGFILDDWYLVGRTAVEGAGGVVGSDLVVSRPGSFLVYVTSFGVAGDDPRTVHAAQMLWMVLAAVLAVTLLRRFVVPHAAAAVVALWLVLPNHLSLETWGSALVADASLVFLLGAALLLSSARLTSWRIACACVLAALSCLTYEASIAPAAAAFIVVPCLVHRRFRWAPAIAGAATLSSVLLWQLTHWHSVKSVQRDPAALTQSVAAHFGWGIVPRGPLASLAVCAALVGTVVVVARLVTKDRRSHTGAAEWLVVAGWVVVLLGTVPFSLYYYAPLGAGDRVTYVSGLGGAMVWVGLLWCVGRHRRVLAVAAALLLAVAATVVRFERMEVWRTAAADAQRIVEAVQAVDPSCEMVVLGPEPIQRENVAAFLDQSNVDGMVTSVRGDRDVRGAMAHTQGDFDAQPARCRVDISELSHLVPDVDLGS
jgi:hypothetical protein